MQCNFQIQFAWYKCDPEILTEGWFHQRVECHNRSGCAGLRSLDSVIETPHWKKKQKNGRSGKRCTSMKIAFHGHTFKLKQLPLILWYGDMLFCSRIIRGVTNAVDSNPQGLKYLCNSNQTMNNVRIPRSLAAGNGTKLWNDDIFKTTHNSSV